MTAGPAASPDYDYVVVGSGAGGGPVACHLAKAGKRVLLLEAGGDHENDHYRVPVFHGLATEDPDLKWNYFVRHYADEGRQRRDCKFREEHDGVLYPRSGTLGGCTAHNALITVYPLNRDWDAIAELTGDPSWRAENMRRYFERLELCQYRGRPPRGYFVYRLLALALRWIPGVARFVAKPGPSGGSRHGFAGWLRTNLADPRLVLRDPQLLKLLIATGRQALADDLHRPLRPLEDFPPLLEDKRALVKSFAKALVDPGAWRAGLIGPSLRGTRAFLSAYLDPNDWRVQAEGLQGLWLAPLATDGRQRNGTREYIRSVQAELPNNLVVKTNALVTRVLLDDRNTALGVEYFEGAHLYRADPKADPAAPAPPPSRALVRGEVILAAGTFNTPQLLMLSGIGPAAELNRLGIPVRVDLPGVGENLQDRYEIGVVSELKTDSPLLPRECAFQAPQPGQPPDPCYEEWRSGTGVYTTNGVVLGIIKKSRPARSDPDLFVFGIPGDFRGYFPDYSKEVTRVRNRFTWAILKAQTRNTAGRVTLRSTDPRDVPDINFRYFDEGNDAAAEDLESVVDGVEFVRQLMDRADKVIGRELVPGPDVQTREQIAEFVRNEAWGHHASGTCKLGPATDPMAVIDGRFRVHGTRNLRVVDASVFPRIPGHFIVSAVYMVGEKAGDVILEDASG